MIAAIEKYMCGCVCIYQVKNIYNEYENVVVVCQAYI